MWDYDEEEREEEERRRRREREQQQAFEGELHNLSQEVERAASQAHSEVDYDYRYTSEISSAVSDWEYAAQRAQERLDIYDLASAATTALAAISTAVQYYLRQKDRD